MHSIACAFDDSGTGGAGGDGGSATGAGGLGGNDGGGGTGGEAPATVTFSGNAKIWPGNSALTGGDVCFVAGGDEICTDTDAAGEYTLAGVPAQGFGCG